MKAVKMRLTPVPGEPEADVECSCGTRFHCDAIFEDNLVLVGGQLVERCPGCGAVNEEKVEGDAESVEPDDDLCGVPVPGDGAGGE